MTRVVPETDGDDWRRPHNRSGTWFAPPTPAAALVVPPVFDDETWAPRGFLCGADGALCYAATGKKWWCYVAYRLIDGRWLLCRSNTSSMAATAPKFAIAADRYDPGAVYEAYDAFDWAALAPNVTAREDAS